jgi:hypothetical protein
MCGLGVCVWGERLCRGETDTCLHAIKGDDNEHVHRTHEVACFHIVFISCSYRQEHVHRTHEVAYTHTHTHTHTYTDHELAWAHTPTFK